MRYFRLFPDCHLVRGPVRATIHCLSKATRLDLDDADTVILSALLDRRDVDSVAAEHGARAQQLLARLVRESVGTYYEQPVVTEPYSPRSPMELRGTLEKPPVIRTVHLQVTDDCDAGCTFCGTDTLLSWQGCNSCLRWGHRPQQRVAQEDLDQVLDELRDLDVRAVVVSGGNPLLERDRLFAMATRLRRDRPDLDITVVCNGGVFDRAIAEQLASLRMRVAFSVFGTTAEAYGSVTGSPWLFSQLQQALTECKRLDIPYTINIVLTPLTRETIEELQEFGESLGAAAEVSFSQPLPRRDNQVKIGPSPTGPAKVEDVDGPEYFQRRKSNFCLDGRIAMALDGSVLPCPAWSEPIMNAGSGHGLLPAFRSFTGSSILEYWRSDKSRIPGCRDCENRFGCADCSLLEWETHRDVAALNRYCDYEPELGIWKSASSSVQAMPSRVVRTADGRMVRRLLSDPIDDGHA